MKVIAILGAGPAGLIAAHAAGLSDAGPIAVFGRHEKSRIGGAQFLHSAIPLLSAAEPDRYITNIVTGTSDDYRRKVYGQGKESDFGKLKVSHEGVEDGSVVGVWDMKPAYDTLWKANEASINPVEIDAAWLAENMVHFSAVFSSIPPMAICQRPGEHLFPYQEIYVDPRPAAFLPQDTIHYNGDPSPSWYRASRIGDNAGGTEWSAQGPKPPGIGAVTIRKPLWTNCDCWPEVTRVGRYGKWRKGVLSHTAWNDVVVRLGSSQN
jgi:hypothetical protein